MNDGIVMSIKPYDERRVLLIKLGMDLLRKVKINTAIYGNYDVLIKDLDAIMGDPDEESALRGRLAAGFDLQ